MITYQQIKVDKTIWWCFYDRSIRLWTVYEVDSEGNQLSIEAEHYHDRKQLLKVHNFDFKTKVE